MNKKVILFGASKLGELAYGILNNNYEIIYFVDNDVGKHGHKLCGIEIVAPNKLYNLYYYCNIIVTSSYDIAIAKQLIEMGIKKFGVFELDLGDVRYYDYTLYKAKNKTTISLITKNNSGCNSYALYKLMPKWIMDKYNINLINEDNKNHNYYFDLSQGKVVIRTHYDKYCDGSQINIQLWHGIPIKGVSYMNKYASAETKEDKHKYWNKMNAIPSYSQLYNIIIGACYGVKDRDTYKITGMPRNDLLLESKGKINLSKVLGFNIDNKKVIFYMPTFRRHIHGEINGDLENFNILGSNHQKIKEFDKFLKDVDTVMILKLHPSHVEETDIIFEQIKGSNIVAITDEQLNENNMDLYEIINSADILVTDYSSIYFDYLLLDRPIIFTPLDFDEYDKNRGFLLEPFDFWTPGPKCKSLDELENEILKYIMDDSYYKGERAIIKNIVHRYKDANSAKRIWKLIDELVEVN